MTLQILIQPQLRIRRCQGGLRRHPQGQERGRQGRHQGHHCWARGCRVIQGCLTLFIFLLSEYVLSNYRRVLFYYVVDCL